MVRIRAATDPDGPVLLALADRLREGVAPWRDEGAVVDVVRGWVEASVAAIDEAGHAVLVAELGSTIVGFVTLGPGSHWSGVAEPSIGELVVAPEAEGQGIGTALVEAVLARVRDRGAVECYLEVRESNQAAQSLYRHFGFAQVGRRRRYYALPTEDALVMRLRI
jgi:ribosomal-protein-alanine acetyltransferase